MKVAISIPDDVFKKAEWLAKKVQKSRSQLYSEALREYMARHVPDEVTEALDKVITEHGQPDDELTTLTATQTLTRIEW